MVSLIRRIVPSFLRSAYHWVLAMLGAVAYGFPANNMIVIGVTGTTGKSSTIEILAHVLETAGYSVGYTSTAKFKVANKSWLNDQKMTMLGRWQTQKLLKQMYMAGCHIAIVETTSEGIKQFRHKGISYDVAVFTNLSPEHLRSHGTYENYKKTKGKLFAGLNTSKRKVLNGKSIPKVIVANADDEQAKYFLSFVCDQQYTFGTRGDCDFKISHIQYSQYGTGFHCNDYPVAMPLLGRGNVYNAAATIAVARALGVEWTQISAALKKQPPIPGRLEVINAGQKFGVIVDYAFEPKALANLYAIVDLISHKRIIHVFGAAGGGRDTSHRRDNAILISGKADVIIVTNEDPYDDDPHAIINDIAQHIIGHDDDTLFRIQDRRAAIAKALEVAQPGDLVLITGKGSEQAIVVKNNRKIPWDDRRVVRQLLAEL